MGWFDRTPALGEKSTEKNNFDGMTFDQKRELLANRSRWDKLSPGEQNALLTSMQTEVGTDLAQTSQRLPALRQKDDRLSEMSRLTQERLAQSEARAQKLESTLDRLNKRLAKEERKEKWSFFGKVWKGIKLVFKTAWNILKWGIPIYWGYNIIKEGGVIKGSQKTFNKLREFIGLRPPSYETRKTIKKIQSLQKQIEEKKEEIKKLAPNNSANGKKIAALKRDIENLLALVEQKKENLSLEDKIQYKVDQEINSTKKWVASTIDIGADWSGKPYDEEKDPEVKKEKQKQKKEREQEQGSQKQFLEYEYKTPQEKKLFKKYIDKFIADIKEAEICKPSYWDTELMLLSDTLGLPATNGKIPEDFEKLRNQLGNGYATEMRQWVILARNIKNEITRGTPDKEKIKKLFKIINKYNEIMDNIRVERIKRRNADRNKLSIGDAFYDGTRFIWHTGPGAIIEFMKEGIVDKKNGSIKKGLTAYTITFAVPATIGMGVGAAKGKGLGRITGAVSGVINHNPWAILARRSRLWYSPKGTIKSFRQGKLTKAEAIASLQKKLSRMKEAGHENSRFYRGIASEVEAQIKFITETMPETGTNVITIERITGLSKKQTRALVILRETVQPDLMETILEQRNPEDICRNIAKNDELLDLLRSSDSAKFAKILEFAPDLADASKMKLLKKISVLEEVFGVSLIRDSSHRKGVFEFLSKLDDTDEFFDNAESIIRRMAGKPDNVVKTLKGLFLHPEKIKALYLTSRISEIKKLKKTALGMAALRELAKEIKIGKKPLITFLEEIDDTSNLTASQLSGLKQGLASLAKKAGCRLDNISEVERALRATSIAKTAKVGSKVDDISDTAKLLRKIAKAAFKIL